MSGEIFYSNSIMQRTKILKGLSVKKIKEIAKYIKLTKDVDIVIKTNFFSYNIRQKFRSLQI